MKRLIGALIAVAALAAPAAAQVREVTTFPLAINYDLDAATFVYPVSQGMHSAPGAGTRATAVLDTIKSNIKLTTGGVASTTVTAVDTTKDPFTTLSAGDFIRFRVDGPTLSPPTSGDTLRNDDTPWLLVVTNADDDTITVNQSVLLPTAGVSWEWRKFHQGGQVGRGWVPVRGYDLAKFNVWLAGTTDGAGFNVRVECRDDNPGLETGSPTVVWPSHTGATAATECGAGTIAAADQTCIYSDAIVAVTSLNKAQVTVDARPWYECRVGFRISVADDGGDAVAETIRTDVTLVKLQ